MARPFGFLSFREKKKDEEKQKSTKGFDLGTSEVQEDNNREFAATENPELKLDDNNKEVDFGGKLQITLRTEPGKDLPYQLFFAKITAVQLLWPNGNILYEGDLLEGQPDGEGKYYSEDGILRYEGTFIRGKMDGRGKFYRKDGSLEYQGETYGGKRQGDGRVFRADGSIEFQGEFTNDHFSLGRYYYPGGQLQYQGQFDEKDCFSGEGRLLSEEGRLIYEGAFVEGEFSGKGTLYSTDGHINYEGDFIKNEFSGRGNHFNERGNLIYQGQFSKGQYQGDGILYNDEGDIVYQGKFDSGQQANEVKKDKEKDKLPKDIEVKSSESATTKEEPE